MAFTAEVSYKGFPDKNKDEKLDKLAKQFRGETFFSETKIRGKGSPRRTVGYDFKTKGKALGFLRTVKKNIKGLGRMFIKESDG